MEGGGERQGGKEGREMEGGKERTEIGRKGGGEREREACLSGYQERQPWRPTVGQIFLVNRVRLRVIRPYPDLKPPISVIQLSG